MDIEDFLIACMDSLIVFPDAYIQHCIVHVIRNSAKFVSYKDLRKVYSVINVESRYEVLKEFSKKWNDLTEFFNYPKDIRKAIYTTNAIESLNFSLIKVTKNKSSFPDDDSIYKIMYLAIKKRQHPLDDVHKGLGTGG